MKQRGHLIPPLLLAVSLAIGGCGQDHSPHDGHAHAAGEDGREAHGGGGAGAHAHEHEESSGADFEEGAGLLLSDEAREAIGLETAEVAQRQLSLQYAATGRVFHSAHQHGEDFPDHKDGHAYAHAMIPSATAELLKRGQTVEVEWPAYHGGEPLQGRLSSLDRDMARAIGQVEAVIEISDPEERLEFGVFLTARLAGAERTALAIPRSALVDAATGRFVYLQNGERWLRRPVKVGGGNEQFVEIVDGLAKGDLIVSKGAVDLWLIELRFTKGGGHSH